MDFMYVNMLDIHGKNKMLINSSSLIRGTLVKLSPVSKTRHDIYGVVVYVRVGDDDVRNVTIVGKQVGTDCNVCRRYVCTDVLENGDIWWCSDEGEEISDAFKRIFDIAHTEEQFKHPAYTFMQIVALHHTTSLPYPWKLPTSLTIMAAWSAMFVESEFFGGEISAAMVLSEYAKFVGYDWRDHENVYSGIDMPPGYFRVSSINSKYPQMQYFGEHTSVVLKWGASLNKWELVIGHIGR